MTRKASFAGFALLVAIALARIASTYHVVAQTVDETPNIACGMQWLDKGRYDYGPFHPPLARAAIALGPYLYGARSQGLPDRWKEGSAVLYSGKRYGATLTLARVGILPFFVLACACVWLWSRRTLGEGGALISVFLFTNLPPVLAHAGLATTDMALTGCVCAAVYAFVRWIEEPGLGRSLILGFAFALAFLSKFSAALFVPVCAMLILALYWLAERPSLREMRKAIPRRLALLAASALLAFLVIWAFYRFSWHGYPAPEIVEGFRQVRIHNHDGHPAYLMGEVRMHGWWYYFPISAGLKTPLAFLLLLVVAGAALAGRRWRPMRWQLWAPLVCGLGILTACMPANLNLGVRYVLAMYPMLSIAAGLGAMHLLTRSRFRKASIALAIALLVWMGVSSARAHPDYIPYFNELAGRHPERFLADSDLDWGQDMKRMAQKLKELHVERMHMACLWSGDDSKLDLPSWDALEPYQPVTGWVAISFTALKTHGLRVAQGMGRSEPGYGWLERYQPVARVGKSILLYDIPESGKK